MSEFFEVIPKELLSPQTEVKVQAKKQHEFKLIASQRKIPGHTLFCLNLKTGEIKVAPIEHTKVVDMMTKEPIYHDRLVIEPHCVYRQALNKKNFMKVLKRERIVVTRVPMDGDVVVEDKLKKGGK